MNLKPVFILLLLFLSGCGGSVARQAESVKSSNAANPAPAATVTGKDATAQVSLEQADKSKTETAPAERKIIRNADLQLEAAEPEKAQQKITSIAESKGGFVIESQQSNNSAEVKAVNIVTMTIRVPAAKFDESLEEIRQTGNRLILQNVKGQDVTEEFVDVEARLKAKKALEAQFLEIMKQGKTVEDALKVQSELGEVRSQIEQIEGRLRFLQNQTSLSTITVRLQTPATYSPNSSGFFYQLTEAFSSGFGFALNFILGLITVVIAILPFFIFVILPIFLLIRYFWKKNSKLNVAREIVKEEIKK